MNIEISNLVNSLAGRGLTEAAGGVILGAYLQQSPSEKESTKEQTMLALLLLQTRKEKQDEANIHEVVKLLGLTDDQVRRVAEAALTITEELDNGQANANG